MPLFEAVFSFAAILLAIVSASLAENPAFVLSLVLYSFYLAAFVFTLLWYRSRLRLEIFYRDTDRESIEMQHWAALALAAILVANPVVVGLQAAAQNRELWITDGVTVEQSRAASGWRTLEGLFLVFNLFYVRYSVLNSESSGRRAPPRCPPATGIFWSVIMSVATQICATVLAAVEFAASNPLFPAWLLAVQAVWVAWSVFYDWFVSMGLATAVLPRFIRQPCAAHESVVVSSSGTLLPRETLLSPL